MKRWLFAVGALCVAAFTLSGGVAHAGLEGQPKPTDDTIIRLRNAVNQFLINGGDVGKARPDLILLVERDVTADVTELLAPALRDPLAYQGLAQTFSDAQNSETDPAKKNYISYNLARLHLFRSQVYTTSAQRRPFLEAAAHVAAQLPETLKDPAAWELKGDIAMEQGQMSAAVAAYGRISGPNSTALAQYKIGVAYQKQSRYREAETAFLAASRADAASPDGGGQLYHYIWQGLGVLYLAQHRDNDSLAALSRSARVKETRAGTFHPKIELARALLAHGYGRQVAAYADDGLKVWKDDPELTQLRNQAKGGQR